MTDEFKSFCVTNAEKLGGCEDSKSVAFIRLENFSTGSSYPWDPLKVAVKLRDMM